MIIKPRHNRYLLEFILIGLLFLDLFIQVIPVMPVTFAIITWQFIRLDYNSNIILSLMILPFIVGSALNGVGISGVGGYFLLLGILLLAIGIVLKKTTFKIQVKSILLMSFLLLFFFFSILTTSGGDYAGYKLFQTSKEGIISLIIFVVLFSNYDKIDAQRLGIFMLLYAFVLLRLSIIVNQISGPSNIVDFGFLRTQTETLWGYTGEVFLIGYHQPGYLFLQGFAIYLMKGSSSFKGNILLLILGGLLTFFTGARQTIVILFAFVITMILMKAKRKLTIPVLVGGVIFFAIYLIETTSLGELFGSTLTEGYIEGGSRGPWLMRGLELFLQNPVTGVGFGRYSLWGNYGNYPHNLFIEILCELGIIGLLFISALTLSALKGTKHLWGRGIYFFLVIFLASMASGGLESNIVVFSFLFALPSHRNLIPD